MPWKKVEEMEQRAEFAIRARKAGANLSALCREYGISRPVGYKVLRRYEEEGLGGIAPRSRRPKSHGQQISGQMVCAVVALRQKHPTWGARMLRELLCDQYCSSEVPSARSIDRVLSEAGLVKKRRRGKANWLDKDRLPVADQPNRVWTVDFKGWWRTKNGSACFPLTIRDAYSRYLISITALPGTGFEGTKEAFHKAFERYGLPDEILSDNGGPFASVLSVQGLTRLSAWWIKLGIRPRRILPACPFMNGSHERMHRDMKAELQRTPLWTLKDEQKRFDSWREEYNTVRPNQALGMKRPAKVFKKSTRKFLLLDYEYPQDMEVRRTSPRGFISWHQKPCFISNALDRETLGLRYEPDDSLSVWFCQLLLGTTDKNFDYPLGGNPSRSPASYRHAKNKKL